MTAMSTPILLVSILFSSSILYKCCMVQSCQSDCTYKSWKSWSCACENATQVRIRDMCCPGGVSTREECAAKCNMSLHWQESATCEKCMNGGTYDHRLKNCICTPAYRGKFCCDEVKCDENYCKHGECNATDYPFSCVCEPGYMGIVCDRDEVKCDENNCKHGECNATDYPFSCVCEPGYTGSVCDKEIQDSLSWWPYVEYALISLGGLVTLTTFGCACFKVGKQLRCLSKNRKEKRKTHKIPKENLRRSQIKPSSIDF